MTLSAIKSCLLTLSLILCATFTVQEKNGIINLISRSQIHCVSENLEDINFINLAMFTSPPLKQKQLAENLLQSGIWDNDDNWITKDSSHMVANVVDRRWEDFEMVQLKYHRFINLNTSISFSVYGAQEVEFFANDEESLDYFTTPINNALEWTTFTILVQNNHISYYINNKDRIRNYSLTPTQIVIRTSQEAYFKFHKHEYKEATNVTKENPTSLTIEQSKNSTLVLYVSLCKSCILEIKSFQNLTITSSIRENSVFEQWQTHRIDLESSEKSKVEFVRKQNNETEKGYWKLDVRLHDNRINTAVYKINNNVSETFTCNYLSTSTNSKQNRRKRNANPIKNPIDCIPGMVGSKCEISCSSVLGEKYNLCQQHKICLNSMTCECAWGFHGPWCEHECDNGKWGMNCQKECKECSNCDKSTGKCSNNDSVWPWLWIALVCFAVISSFLSGYIFRKKTAACDSKQKYSVPSSTVVPLTH